jgi:ribosome-associated protein
MSAPLIINDRVTLPASELEWSAARSSGPGGQNVNKVASKVELRFDLPRTSALDDGAKARLRALAGSRLDADGRVLVVSQRTRDQSRNLEDARAKLRELVLRALERPRPRRATRPTVSSRARRMDAKRHQGDKKRTRKVPRDDE